MKLEMRKGTRMGKLKEKGKLKVIGKEMDLEEKIASKAAMEAVSDSYCEGFSSGVSLPSVSDSCSGGNVSCSGGNDGGSGDVSVSDLNESVNGSYVGKRQVMVVESAKKRLRELFGCSNVMVWKALHYESDSALARRIRLYAVKELGGVVWRSVVSG